MFGSPPDRRRIAASAALRDHLHALPQLQLLPGRLWPERRVVASAGGNIGAEFRRRRVELLFSALT
ncbi:MAG: hypothetical protein HYX27_04750 [Acidobacteria bacterium]|nr:hypothetical protein [Acidobacteriota bacterium]